MPDKLPKGWVQTTLGEIRRDASTGISQRQMLGGIFELYSVPAFEHQKPEIVRGDTIGSNKSVVKQGDVLLCKINPRINRAWVVAKPNAYGQIASTEWIVFSKQEGVAPEFLAYFFSQDSFRDYLSSNVAGVGGSLMRVNTHIVDAYPIKLPPTREQERIAAKLDAALSKIKRAELAAYRAQGRLRYYRIAVLHAAVTGELTREWRSRHKPDETGSRLLKNLLKVRRAKWEQAELRRLVKAGRPPKDGKWKTRYRDPMQPTTNDLPQLPKGWTWISIDQLAWASGYGTSVKCTREAGGPAVLRIPNIRDQTLNFDDLKFATSLQEFRDEDFVAPGANGRQAGKWQSEPISARLTLIFLISHQATCLRCGAPPMLHRYNPVQPRSIEQPQGV